MAKAKPNPPVANMGAGADEQNAKPDAKPAPKADSRLDAAEKQIAALIALVSANGWSLPKALQ